VIVSHQFFVTTGSDCAGRRSRSLANMNREARLKLECTPAMVYESAVGASTGLNPSTRISIPSSPANALRAVLTGFDVAPTYGIRVRVADDWYQSTDFALGQIAGRAGVPLQYLRELAAPQSASWQHQLASEILRQHYGNAGDVRVLVRSVRGQLRGWVSDKYRRLDSRPLVDALANEARSAGAVPIDGVVTETRVAIKVIVPRILDAHPRRVSRLWWRVVEQRFRQRDALLPNVRTSRRMPQRHDTRQSPQAGASRRSPQRGDRILRPYPPT